MDEPTYIATAREGDVLVVTMPNDVGHAWLEQARDDLQAYLEPRGIGLVIVANGIKAEVCSSERNGE